MRPYPTKTVILIADAEKVLDILFRMLPLDRVLRKFCRIMRGTNIVNINGKIIFDRFTGT